MITLVKLNGWIGTGGRPGPLAEAIVFDGPRQREDAWEWAKSKIPDYLLCDRLTLLFASEEETAARILCTCGKVMQNGRGSVSHGICGGCLKKQVEEMEAEK